MTKAYTAPAHCSGIAFSTGRQLPCEPGGTLETPDDLQSSEIADLIRNGFVPVPDPEAEADAPATAAKASKKTPADPEAAA